MPTNILRDCTGAEEALLKRYGKAVTITGKSDVTEQGIINWVTLDITSSKGAKYSLTDRMKDNLTDTVTLIHPNGELQFKRYLDAEVAMIDKISEE